MELGGIVRERGVEVAGESFAGFGTPLVPTWTRVDEVSLRRTEALISPLKPTFSHSAIWASYSERNFARRSCPQTSGVLTPMVP